MSEPGGSGLPRAVAPVELSARMSGPSGAPVLVLGNSLGTTMELWEPQLDALGRRFRLLRYEHRGHGGSPAPPGPYAISDLGTDVLALLDEFEVATACYAAVAWGRDRVRDPRCATAGDPRCRAPGQRVHGGRVHRHAARPPGRVTRPEPHGVIAIASGPLPTGMGVPAALVAVSIGVTVPGLLSLVT